MAPNARTLDPRTPVVVAVGQIEQRTSDLDEARSPTQLLAEAVRSAGADSGSGRLVSAIDAIAVCHILSHSYRDPGQLVADELGLGAVRTLYTDDGGNYPQALLHRACREIAGGADATWVIGGAETWRTRTAARSAGRDLGWPRQGDEVAPDELVTNPHPLIHDGEWARGVVLPATVYALFEQAIRAERGWTIDEQRDRLAARYERFSAIAAANPHAWIRRAWSAAEIRDPSPDNRMVGFPYTKVMNANNHVEQAACVVVTSVERARALQIPTDRWVFPWAGTEAHDHWFVSHRWDLAHSPAIAHAGRHLYELAGVGPDSLGLVDVYSCFPSAVEVAAAELGIDDGRDLTVTGGLSFGGGPWNNYVSHALATMVERLRAEPDEVGLVTANGGYLTKHALGVYAARPADAPYRWASVQGEVDALPRRELAEVVDAAVTVEAAVAMHDRNSQPERAVVSCRLDDGRRAWGATDDADVLKRIVTEETVGLPGHLDDQGRFELTA